MSWYAYSYLKTIMWNIYFLIITTTTTNICSTIHNKWNNKENKINKSNKGKPSNITGCLITYKEKQDKKDKKASFLLYRWETMLDLNMHKEKDEMMHLDDITEKQHDKLFFVPVSWEKLHRVINIIYLGWWHFNQRINNPVGSNYQQYDQITNNMIKCTTQMWCILHYRSDTFI